MKFTVQIPDDLARRLVVYEGQLSRRALEPFALAEFKRGHVTETELRSLRGFGTRYQLDGFLKSHGIYEDYTMEDFERERESLKLFMTEKSAIAKFDVT